MNWKIKLGLLIFKRTLIVQVSTIKCCEICVFLYFSGSSLFPYLLRVSSLLLVLTPAHPKCKQKEDFHTRALSFVYHFFLSGQGAYALSDGLPVTVTFLHPNSQSPCDLT